MEWRWKVQLPYNKLHTLFSSITAVSIFDLDFLQIYKRFSYYNFMKFKFLQIKPLKIWLVQIKKARYRMNMNTMWKYQTFSLVLIVYHSIYSSLMLILNHPLYPGDCGEKLLCQVLMSIHSYRKIKVFAIFYKLVSVEWSVFSKATSQTNSPQTEQLTCTVSCVSLTSLALSFPK